MRRHTVIVGAGISGLACARTLRDAGEEFTIVSRDVGGRVTRSSDGALPFGAFYVRADYEHVGPFVQRGRKVRARDMLRHDRAGAYTRLDRRLLGHPIQVGRFLLLLQRFRRRYHRFQRRSSTIGQAAAITSDPFLAELYREPAAETVRRHGVEDLARAYVAPVMHATAFTPLAQLTGFTMLLLSLPLLEPMHEFTMNWRELSRGQADRVVPGIVRRIETVGGGFHVVLDDGDALFADHVVVAAGPGEAARLAGVERTKGGVDVHMFEVDGRLRPPWSQAQLHLFAEYGATLAILQRTGSPALVCSRDPEPAWDDLFESWSVLDHHHWQPAFHVVGDVLLDAEPAPRLFMIGDHNVSCLEDAFITGVHAATRIISGSPSAGSRVPAVGHGS